MNDKELVDRIVALGVVDILPEGPEDDFRYLTPNGDLWRSVEAVLEDWSVAGALMERLGNFLIERSGTLLGVSTQYATPQPGKFWRADASGHNESLPRAIIEACVEALTHPSP